MKEQIGLIQKANELGYINDSEIVATKNLDRLSLNSSVEQTENYFVQKWLRESYKIFVEVNAMCVGESNTIQYKYVILHHYSVGNHLERIGGNFYFNSYEEALENGLQEALDGIKSYLNKPN